MAEKEKIKLDCAVLCEGKYDKIKLSSVIDGMIITTDGFGIFNNAEKRALLKRLCETRGLVIITDSDKAGFFIRSKLKGMLDPDKVKHVYVPQIKGREKRKKHDSKEGLLGVEGIDTDTIRKVLISAGFDKENGKNLPKAPITKAQFYSLGLSGGEKSAEERKKLCAKLQLPETLTANALISALSMLGIGYERVAELVDDKSYDEKYVEFFPEDARRVLDTLSKSGHKAYFVGGCVRDLLMNKKAHDFDMTTDASSEEIIHHLTKDGFEAVLTGADCGTVSARMKGGNEVEITPHRAESDYTDHRHPEKVVFVKDLSLDLSRRDFTINAIALTPDSEKGVCFIDLFDGMGDISRGVIRCVNDPFVRFDEDALRILRALRFASRFGFEIEEKTACAMREKRHLLSFVSWERKREELEKILENPDSKGVLAQFPEIFSEIVGNFSGNGIDLVNGGFCEKLFYLLRENGSESAIETAKRLKMSRDECEKIADFCDIRELEKIEPCEEIIIKHAERYAEYLKAFGGCERAFSLFADKSIPKKTGELAVDGKDVMELGFSGVAVGKIMNGLLRAVLKRKIDNKKENLINYIKKNSEEML